jgi:hypothetical protein
MLVGIICPAGKNVTFDQCFSCTKRCFPLFVLELYCANLTAYQAAHTNTVSVSQISTCLRRSFYEATQPHYTSVISITSAVKGTLVHESLATFFSKKTGALSEYHLRREFAQPLTGTLDLYLSEILYDFKTSKKVYPKYKNQLNIYRILLEKPVKKMKIIFVDKFTTVEIPEIEVDIGNRVMTLVNGVTNSVIPEAEEDLEECSHCFFTSQCFAPVQIKHAKKIL